MANLHPTQLEDLDEPLEDFHYYLAVRDNPRRVVNATEAVRVLLSKQPFLMIRRTEESDVETKVKLVFDDPYAFGMVLVDAARTIADAFAHDEGATNSEYYLKRIRDGFEAEFNKPTTPIKLKTPPG